MAREQQAGDDADRVDGVDDGERDRREVLALGVDAVEGARGGGEGGQGEERERDGPEARPARQLREPSCPGAWMRKCGWEGEGGHAASLRHRPRDRARASPWSVIPGGVAGGAVLLDAGEPDAEA